MLWLRAIEVLGERLYSDHIKEIVEKAERKLRREEAGYSGSIILKIEKPL